MYPCRMYWIVAREDGVIISSAVIEDDIGEAVDRVSGMGAEEIELHSTNT